MKEKESLWNLYIYIIYILKGIIDNHLFNPFLSFTVHYRLERFLEIICTDEYIYIMKTYVM